MDSFEFLSRITPREIPGRSLRAYYSSLFSDRMGNTPAMLLPKYCALNFLVQQLSVRSLYHRAHNRYVFCGDSSLDFAASLLRAPNLTMTSFLSEGVSVDHDTAKAILDVGAADEQKEYEVRNESLLQLLEQAGDRSHGLIIDTFPRPQERIHELIRHTSRILSPKGKALHVVAGDCSTICALEGVKSAILTQLPQGVFGGTAVLMEHLL